MFCKKEFKEMENRMIFSLDSLAYHSLFLIWAKTEAKGSFTVYSSDLGKSQLGNVSILNMLN